jgi:exopolysaccharide biosynthesis protein
LLAVDGRSTASVGMTVTELATTLASLGAWDALNFDGGGSTALVIDGRVVNVPSDPTGERAVANALLILDRR